jgi:hypothetical protein
LAEERPLETSGPRTGRVTEPDRFNRRICESSSDHNPHAAGSIGFSHGGAIGVCYSSRASHGVG